VNALNPVIVWSAGRRFGTRMWILSN